MPYTVEIPGHGTVEFPDDVSLDEAQKEIEKSFPQTGAEIADRINSDPNYEPTTEEFKLYKQFSKEKHVDFLDAFSQGVDYMLGIAGRGAAAGVTEGAALNPANYLEGFAQGTQRLYGMVAQSQDPNSVLFGLKDLINGTGTIDSQRQQFLEARKFNNKLLQYENGELTVLPKELVNPEFVQAVSLVADPTLFLPGLGEALGVGKLATKGVGLAARGVGRGVSALARPVETATKAGERILAEAINVTPEGLATAARTTGVASALGVAPAVGMVGAVPLIATTAREAGEALATAGENLLTQPSRIGPLESIGRIPGANLRQRTLGVIGQYGGDAALDTALRATAGSIEGGAIGAGLGYLGAGEEGAAFGAGSGVVLGAGGASVGRGVQRLTGKAAREARQGDFDRYVASQDEKTAGLLRQIESQHGLDVASGFMDATALVRGQLGDVNVTLLSAEDYRERFGTNTRGIQIPEADTPAIYVNADLFGEGKGDSPLYTLGHELFHALERSEQLSSRASEIKDALVGSYVVTDGVSTKVTNGLFDDAEVEARFNQYRDKLTPQQAEALAQYDTPQKRADFVASEIAAEYTGALFAGQKPDALLRGFSGLTRTLLDQALTKNADSALNRIAQRIENTFGLKPLDSILFPDLKQASPQVNAMLRDLVRARRKLDERILAADSELTGAIKPSDMGNPIAAKVAQDFGIAEQNPDGTTRWLTDEEINAREWRDNQAVQDILLTRPGARLVDGVIQGRFSPEQLSAIEQSQQVSSRMKDKIRAVAASINNGNSIFIDYNAATRRVKNKITGNYTSKYSSGIRMTQRELLPYAFYFSKADNPVIKAIDLTKIRRAVERSIQPDKSIAGIWENMDGFMSDLAKYFTNLDSPRRQPSAVALDSDAKAKFIGDLVNEAEKGGRKFVRDFRLDRMGAVSPRNFTARISEEAIQFSKQRWMPAEQVGDTSVTSSEEGYRIVSKDKNRLYGPDGKLIGIYDTQLEAERKADATQARVQSEIDQQQRLEGDEGRQTAEAGGGDRPVSSTQGREEGGQGLGQVRQAGDVTKTDGLAILDGDLQLNLPKRPTVMEIATALQDRFGEPIDWEKSTPDQNKVLRDAVVQEAVRAVGLHPEAKGWYDENIKLTVDILKELDPDIAKPENDFIFKILLAATSDGNKVRPQFLQSWDEYTNWKNTGKISGQFVSGDRVGNIRKNLYKVEAMIQAVGWEKVRDFLTKKGTVTEIREALVRDFGFTKKEAADVGKSELADEVVPYAIVLGPKLGSFFNNLYGDFSSVTMDRWFMRTMGRLTGTQVDTSAFTKIRSLRAELRKSISNLTPSEKEFLKISSDKIKGDNIDAAAKSISTRFSKKETRDRATQLASEGRPFMEEVRKRSNALKKIQSPLVEAPLNGRHRRWIRNRIAEVQAELKSKGIELENADLQAVLWYLEKELYDKLNYRAKPGDSDYASAAANLYERVVGRPSSVYAGSSGRIRSVGGGGRDVAVGAANPAEAGAAVAGARLMPSDSDYMTAVKSGDTAKAQQLVDQAAKAAGYSATRYYHGSTSGQKPPNVLDRRELFFLTESQDVAEKYANNNQVISVLIPQNQNILSVSGPKDLLSRLPKELAKPHKDNEFSWEVLQDPNLPGLYEDSDVIGFLRDDLGYDGIRVKDDVAGGERHESLAWFRTENIKSADPVTYDNSGNVIPLSQRFQQSSADIRYMPAPVPDPSIPGAYSMNGYRILPGKTKGRVRVYSPTGGLLGIASSNDEAQRMIQRRLR